MGSKWRKNNTTNILQHQHNFQTIFLSTHIFCRNGCLLRNTGEALPQTDQAFAGDGHSPQGDISKRNLVRRKPFDKLKIEREERSLARLRREGNAGLRRFSGP
jgi:hypothetical protein